MRNVYVADFETTTDPDDVRVWAWGLYRPEKDKFEWGKDVASFVERLRTLPNRSKVYFHNLKFDSEFLMYYLFKELGYERVDSRKIGDREFTTLISHMGAFYSMKIGFNNKTIEILDSLKIIQLRVRDMPKAFGIEELKGEIDYHKLRPIGYDPTDKEIKYLEHDVLIVAKALAYFFEQKLTKMTIASNAFSYFKKLINPKHFDNWFPQLEQDSELRQSYKGGFTYVAERFKQKDVGEGIVLDVNSLYPSIMYYKKLPYGEPIYYEGEYVEDKIYPLYIQTFRCNFDLKKDHVPSLQIKKSMVFRPTEYLESSDGNDVTLCMTSVDIKLFFEQYDVKNVEWFGGWKFKASDKIFKPYIDKWMKLKEESTITGNKGLRTLAKLLLNSLYGKFGLNPIVKSKIPFYDKHQDMVRYHYGEEEHRDPIYVPIASFVTAYARYTTIGSAQKNYDRFVYADTDSLHLLGRKPPDNLEIDDVKLGYWALESEFANGRFLRAKTYMENELLSKEKYGKLEEEQKEGWEWNEEFQMYNKLHFTVAGLPEDARKFLNFENFIVGTSIHGKKSQKRVRGGVIIHESDFTIKG